MPRLSKKIVFVVGIDRAVTDMFRAADWDVVNDPNLADFLCFTGGSDVSPELYGEPNHGLSHTNPARDTRETNLYNTFKGFKGFIGICRGGQFLNVMNGGKLRQHIEGHHGYQTVSIVKPDGSLEPLTFELHEDHHQEILPTPKARVFLKARADNVVEGCWYGSTKSFCFQPHPEWGHKVTKEVFFAWLHNFNNF